MTLMWNAVRTDPTRASDQQRLLQLRHLDPGRRKQRAEQKANLRYAQSKPQERMLDCEESSARLQLVSALSADTPGQSQKYCFVGKTSGTSPNCVHQHVKYKWWKLLPETAQSAKMSAWSDSVLAAEATKAGRASEVTCCLLYTSDAADE